MTTKQILLSALILGAVNNAGLEAIFNKKKINDELLTATQDNKVLKVKVLLELGANPNAKDKEGNTPLHLLPFGHRFTVNSGGADAEIAQLLLQYGANPNIQNNKGDTPAHTSACNYSILRLLDARGADFTIKNNTGKTASNYTELYTRPNSAFDCTSAHILLKDYENLKKDSIKYYSEINHLNEKCYKTSI